MLAQTHKPIIVLISGLSFDQKLLLDRLEKCVGPAVTEFNNTVCVKLAQIIGQNYVFFGD